MKGMMDGAYFTSRKELLDFFNSLLSMSLTKIEETATGAVACQLIDYMYPGTIPMKRVNWEANAEFQYIENYKILQAAFVKNQIQKHADVDRLIRAKYQDNLEFCQWLKAFYEHVSPPDREDYDPVARRGLGKGGRNLNAIFLPRAGRGKNGNKRVGPTRPVIGNKTTSKRSMNGSMNGSISAGKASGAGIRTSHIPSTSKRDNNLAEAELMRKNAELKRKNAELDLTLEGLEKERDFYFDKLRGIEVMCQVHDEQGAKSDSVELIQRIFKVLYAKLEDNIVVTDEGEVR
jgi:RP/EB family microtubule-associated protein